MLATSPPKVQSKQILEMFSNIIPGDIIFRKYSYYLDSYFIPGVYSHSGIVLNREEIYHATAKGITKDHPIDFIKDTDGFLVVRPYYDNPFRMNLALDIAKALFDKKAEYDFTFNDDNKYYCHEFVCECLKAASIKIPKSEVKFGVFPFNFKLKIYLPDEIIIKCRKIYQF